MKSLSRRFLVSVGLMSLLMTLLGTLGAFVVFQRELQHRQIDYLEHYVRERGTNIDRRFSNLTSLHKAAGEELARRTARLSDAEARRLADVYFPRQADGTRRSRDRYFDGAMEGGNYTYGMGAMIAGADRLTAAELKTLVASFELVSGFGQAARREYDNFYFFTPPVTRVVMFAPDRPDKLMFYRRQAPAGLDISKEEMSVITSPKADPGRTTRCTSLQRLVQDTTGRRLATGCLTPAYVDGRYVGAFGSSMELTGFFMDAVKTPLPGATSYVVTGKGDLIAQPGFLSPKSGGEAEVARYGKTLGLDRMVGEIARRGHDRGVITSPDGKSIVAYSRLSGPNWYFLLSYPKAAVAASAAKSAAWVLLVGGLAAVVQVALVVLLARREIVWPLRRLAASCEPEAFGDIIRPDVSGIEQRHDEMGVLARALRSERLNADELMSSLEDRVKERTAQLERANTEKSRFLANMSHELRTPLNGVIAVAETLQRQQKTAKGRELTDLIVSSGRLLERVLTDILDFSKIEAGQITLSRDDFAMSGLIRRIAELHRASAEAKGLMLDWGLAPEADARFGGDTVRLTQVLSNLLSNAVKFTESGRVLLRVDVGADGQVRFEVSDTGIGFDEEVHARLFRRFEQADDTIRRRFGGTGLGLAISRSLVELMGGTLEAHSEPGRGSTFTAIIPLERLAGEANVEIDEGAAEPADVAGCRVLLAEDHPTNQKVVQLVLGAVGITPVIVENGIEALAAFETGAYDVVLMDMQMPEMDGLTATTRLREMELANGRVRTPVIMLTANALDDHIRASYEAGCDLHLPKPIRAELLIESIARITRGRRVADQGVAAA